MNIESVLLFGSIFCQNTTVYTVIWQSVFSPTFKWNSLPSLLCHLSFFSSFPLHLFFPLMSEARLSTSTHFHSCPRSPCISQSVNMTICQNYPSFLHVYNYNSLCLNKSTEPAAGLLSYPSLSCFPISPPACLVVYYHFIMPSFTAAVYQHCLVHPNV